MSALSKLEKLMYSIGVVDKASAPVNKIMAKINQLSSQTAGAQDQMMRGFMGAAAGGLALSRSLAPAIDHTAALGEVQSLGVMQSGLDLLTKTAFEFSGVFGGNSAEFVRSAYDIQSAIGGLTDADLSSFTQSSNILAIATKADASTITNYMGTMYGVFEKTANKMGKANWVKTITGQTATAVQMFKTTGTEMNSAFQALSGKATNKGINSAEQMTILGELQLVTKSGSVAGTQYAAFIDGIGKAQKSLGIALTTDTGDMLGVDVVLSRINEKLTGLGAVDKTDVLNKAFGSKVAANFVDNLSGKINKLTNGINALNAVSDDSKAVEMATIIASPWDRLSGTFNAAATAMGQRLLPVVEPFVEMLSVTFMGVVGLTEKFPVLSSALATVVVGAVGLMTAIGLVNVMMGLYRYTMIATGIATSATTVLTKIHSVGLLAYRGAVMAAQAATWLFNAALIANPIGLVVAGVTLLIAGVIALVYYWNDIVNAFKDTAWGQALPGMFDNVTAKFNAFIDGAKSILEWLGLLDGTEAELQARVTTAIPDNAIAINTPLMQGYMQQQQKLTAQQENSKRVNASSAYKVEKSPFAQQLSSSISHNSNANTDQSKRVYIDNVTMKSDDIANDFEKLMEIAG